MVGLGFFWFGVRFGGLGFFGFCFFILFFFNDGMGGCFFVVLGFFLFGWVFSLSGVFFCVMLVSQAGILGASTSTGVR